MEKRLKEEILEEVKKYDGNIILHDENSNKEVKNK
jgi:hypothetical protein